MTSKEENAFFEIQKKTCKSCSLKGMLCGKCKLNFNREKKIVKQIEFDEEENDVSDEMIQKEKEKLENMQREAKREEMRLNKQMRDQKLKPTDYSVDFTSEEEEEDEIKKLEKEKSK